MKEMQKLLSRVRSCVDRYSMIEDGDRIAVGVSGGKDSLALLCVLSELRKFYPEKYDLCALMLDMGFDASETVGAAPSDTSEIAELCSRLGVEFHVKRTEIARVIFDVRKESNPCSLAGGSDRFTISQRNTG